MLGVRVLGPRLSFTVIKMQAVMKFFSKPHSDSKTSCIAAIIRVSETILTFQKVSSACYSPLPLDCVFFFFDVR